MSAIWDEALAQWHEMRSAYQDYLEAKYAAAENDCNAIMLSRRGLAAGVDPMTLFYGPRSRVVAYASEELQEWFRAHGRITIGEFERQYRQSDRW